MTAIAGWACVVTLLLLSALVLYQWILATAALLLRPRRTPDGTDERSRMLVLIPAHDEEGGLASTLRSLEAADYPRDKVHTVVIADRCTDGTAPVARKCGATCLERSSGVPGKGAAIAWAIDELRRAGTPFDALVVVDADTIVDPAALGAFDAGLRAGHEVQQGYNYLSNPWESPFTRIIAVTSILRNGLFYTGKTRLGLPGMLTGTGMCFSRRILDRHAWTAFSVGEDWEFSVALLLSGESIHFNPDARVLARESSGFSQASSQRLRWASGRQAVAGTSARALLVRGMRLRRPSLWDAAVTIAAPTYSAQVSLALACFVVAWFLPPAAAWGFVALWSAALLVALGAYFVLGAALTASPRRALGGIALIPLFLPWRMAIECLGFLGYGRKRWVRTARLSTSR